MQASITPLSFSSLLDQVYQLAFTTLKKLLQCQEQVILSIKPECKITEKVALLYTLYKFSCLPKIYLHSTNIFS
jgi:hypothetical protein